MRGMCPRGILTIDYLKRVDGPKSEDKAAAPAQSTLRSASVFEHALTYFYFSSLMFFGRGGVVRCLDKLKRRKVS